MSTTTRTCRGCGPNVNEIGGPASVDRLVISKTPSLSMSMFTVGQAAPGASETRVEELTSKGERKSLADVLVEDGHLTRSQAVRLGKSMDDDSMYRPAQQIPGFQILKKLKRELGIK